MKAILKTSAGSLVADDKQIPDFVTGAPAVVVWGNRVFQLENAVADRRAGHEMTAEYREVFFYHIP